MFVSDQVSQIFRKDRLIDRIFSQFSLAKKMYQPSYHIPQHCQIVHAFR